MDERNRKLMPAGTGKERSAMAKAETSRAVHFKAESSIGGGTKFGTVPGHAQATHVMPEHMAVAATKRRDNVAEPAMKRVKQHGPGEPMKYMHRDMEARVAAHRPMNRSKG